MKRILVLLLLVLCTFGFVFAEGAKEQQEKTITLATGDAIGSLRNLAGEYFKEEIEKHPELNLKVNHVQGAVLGTANQIMDQVVEGSVHLFGNDIAWIVPYDQDFQPISFGFMYRDAEHMKAYFNSDIFNDLADKVAQSSGMRIIAPVPMASRMFFSVKPLNTIDDFKGLKVRAPGLEMFVKSYEAYGASPTTVAWNEIFLALKTKLVEAAHGPVADVIANKWHLAAPFITRTEDMYAANAWYVNEDFWQGLTDAQREGIQDALDATNEWSAEQSKLSEESIIAEMVSQGATYSSSFADREILREQAIEAVKKLEASGKWSAGLVDKIQAIE
ncbi:MAG: TRAP transporter substrate-binding protein [Sphaerochaetaceae bacterium]|nr:TRAP transporter substrate-binding protein [Sphaerochaetaceae bacterium]MDC7247914.1 TRAP transporter substrate-binding protein [Sphaerochaetaceae bacterium]